MNRFNNSLIISLNMGPPGKLLPSSWAQGYALHSVSVERSFHEKDNSFGSIGCVG